MTKLQNDLSQMELTFRFQWMVGDTQALKKQLRAIAKPSWHYAVTVASRFVSYGAVFLVAWLLLPGEPLSTVLWIAVAAGLSVYVSWGLSTYMGRKLEELTNARAGMAPAWLMSHPKTDERIAALDRLEAKWDKG